MNKNHTGIYVSSLRESAAAGDENAAADLAAYTAGPGHPVDPNPAKRECRTCGRRVHFRRRTYGPNGRVGGWQHSGNGLAQYAAWNSQDLR
jgi:hypothetical protein